MKAPDPPVFTTRPDALPPTCIDELRASILASPYLLENNLTAGFAGIRGWSVVFRRDGLPKVLAEFPAFEPYLQQMLDPECTAFYLNPLVLARSSRVKAHIDRSLYPYCEECGTPRWVTVLYVAVPSPLTGGVLQFWSGGKPLGRVVPTVNTTVRFLGHVAHEVTPVAEPTEGLRISLVCEQYALDPPRLNEVPELWIETTDRRYQGAG